MKSEVVSSLLSRCPNGTCVKVTFNADETGIQGVRGLYLSEGSGYVVIHGHDKLLVVAIAAAGHFDGQRTIRICLVSSRLNVLFAIRCAAGIERMEVDICQPLRGFLGRKPVIRASLAKALEKSIFSPDFLKELHGWNIGTFDETNYFEEHLELIFSLKDRSNGLAPVGTIKIDCWSGFYQDGATRVLYTDPAQARARLHAQFMTYLDQPAIPAS